MTAGHWDGVYATKAETAVSWFQPEPTRSLDMIARHAPERELPVIDVGGGASRLVDELAARDYTDLTVLDIAASGLEHSRERLGANAARVEWIVADVTRWRPERAYGVWHDRAVFHFLTAPADQEAYLAALAAGTRPGSVAIIATFALDGPEKCSGLPVQRYSAGTLALRLGSAFDLAEQAAELHTTPWGTTQSFTCAAFRRR